MAAVEQLAGPGPAEPEHVVLLVNGLFGCSAITGTSESTNKAPLIRIRAGTPEIGALCRIRCQRSWTAQSMSSLSRAATRANRCDFNLPDYQ